MMEKVTVPNSLPESWRMLQAGRQEDDFRFRSAR